MGIRTNIIKSIVGRLSNLLPDRARYILINCLVKTKQFKYKNEEIFIKCASGWEFARVNSACTEEPETIRWIEEYIKPGEVLYDIGANIGIYSLIAAKHSKGDLKVYAFEPSFPTFKSLCENIALNNLQGSIIPLNMALSDKTGLGKLHYAGLSAGDSQHMFGEYGNLPNKPVLSMHSLSYKIDDLLKQLQLEPPDHIKIDVDGIELKVLMGAAEALKNIRLRSLSVEVNEALPDSHKITDLLEACGFKLSSRNKHKAAEENESCEIYNLIFIK